MTAAQPRLANQSESTPAKWNSPILYGLDTLGRRPLHWARIRRPLHVLSHSTPLTTFTDDLVETWIAWKRENELDEMALRPHPYEFHIYYDS